MLSFLQTFDLVSQLVLPLSQLFIALIVLSIAIVSYRYTVRATVRSAISEVPPLVLAEYALIPTVDSVRWRPWLARRVGVSQSPRTSLQVVVYERDGDRRQPADAKKFGQKFPLNEQEGNEIQRTFEEHLGVEYDLDEAHIKEVNLHGSGISISCHTNKPDQLQNVTKAVLRYYGERSDEQSEQQEPEEPE